MGNVVHHGQNKPGDAFDCFYVPPSVGTTIDAAGAVALETSAPASIHYVLDYGQGDEESTTSQQDDKRVAEASPTKADYRSLPEFGARAWVAGLDFGPGLGPQCVAYIPAPASGNPSQYLKIIVNDSGGVSLRQSCDQAVAAVAALG